MEGFEDIAGSALVITEEVLGSSAWDLVLAGSVVCPLSFGVGGVALVGALLGGVGGGGKGSLSFPQITMHLECRGFGGSHVRGRSCVLGRVEVIASASR